MAAEVIVRRNPNTGKFERVTKAELSKGGGGSKTARAASARGFAALFDGNANFKSTLKSAIVPTLGIFGVFGLARWGTGFVLGKLEAHKAGSTRPWMGYIGDVAVGALGYVVLKRLAPRFAWVAIAAGLGSALLRGVDHLIAASAADDEETDGEAPDGAEAGVRGVYPNGTRGVYRNAA